MILVITENLRQYQNFLKDEGVRPTDATFVHSLEQLYGWDPSDIRIVRCGQWWKNPVADSDALRALEQYICQSFPTEEELLIKEAKDMISYRANMAGMQFGEEDIVVADEGVAGKIVFLRRTRSHKTVLNEETGEYERVYDEEGNPVYDYQPLMWLEALDKAPTLRDYRFGRLPVDRSVFVPHIPTRVVMRAPWLVCWVKGDKSVSGEWRTLSLDVLLSPLDRAREYEGRFDSKEKK